MCKIFCESVDVCLWVQVPTGDKRGCRILWKWSDRQLWAAWWVCVLGTEVRFPAEATSAFRRWTISPTLLYLYFLYGENLRIVTGLFYDNNINVIFLIGKLSMVGDLVAILYYFVFESRMIREQGGSTKFQNVCRHSFHYTWILPISCVVLSADFSLLNAFKEGWRGGWAVLVLQFREAGSGSQCPGEKLVSNLLEKKKKTTESHVLGEISPQTKRAMAYSGLHMLRQGCPGLSFVKPE